MAKSLWFLLLCLFLAQAPVDGAPLRAATANWYPFAYYDETHELRGIAVEIMQQLAKQTGQSVDIQLYPATRLAQLFQQGRLDINIADSPLWNPRDPRTPPLFTVSYLDVNEYLYFAAEHPPRVDDINDLQSMRIGTEAGYYYPMLEPAFRTGSIKRVEYPQAIDMPPALQQHKLDAMAMDEWLFGYLAKSGQLTPDHFYRGLQLSHAPLGMKLSPALKGLKPALDRALDEMQKSGAISDIIFRYTGRQNENINSQ